MPRLSARYLKRYNENSINEYLLKVTGGYNQSVKKWLINILEPNLTDKLRSAGYETLGWVDDTGNLRASIGVGIYDGSGTLMAMSESMSTSNVDKKGNKTKFNGNTMLLTLLRTGIEGGNIGRFRDAQGRFISGVGNKFSVKVVVAVPYGWILNSSQRKVREYKSTGGFTLEDKPYFDWIKRIQNKAETIIRLEWSKNKQRLLRDIKRNIEKGATY